MDRQHVMGRQQVVRFLSRLSMLSVLRNRNYRLMWSGRVVSMLGVQFSMIALPWLVLQLTGSGLAMGTVMAAGGIPRAIFMLVGGALTDRFSSRTIMILASVCYALLMVSQATLVLTGVITFWMVLGLNVIFGMLGAFYFPAVASMIPQIVEDKDLVAANGVLQATMNLCASVGPAVAGTMIVLLSGGDVAATEGGEAAAGLRGIGLAFAFNAVTFTIVAFLISLMRMPARPAREDAEKAGMFDAIREGFSFVWNDKSMRALFFLMAALNFFMMGPMAIGIPILAATRFLQGAASFGLILSGFGAGSVVGAIFVGLLPSVPEHQFGRLITRVASLQAITIALLGFAPNTSIALAITCTMGMGSGYTMVMLMTWFQRRTPVNLLGRAMSLFMFASAGLQPISMAIAGAIVEFSPTGLFVFGGTMVFLVAQTARRSKAIRELGRD